MNHFLLLLLFSISSLNSSQYIWPTDNIDAITTTFGEPRSRRFHAGIDVRTYGQINKKLYSIQSGNIKRINISPYKYGKAIYIQLNDGNIVLYSHINKFSEKIENFISSLKIKFNKNYFDYNLKKDEKINIEKGEIIGYSGDSGSLSGPHLHFEIRDSLNNPLNPLKYYNNFEDTIKPIIDELAFIPLSSNTWINGIQDYISVKPKKINDYKYVIEDTISVIGKFGIAIDTYDKVNTQPFKFGIYNIELFIDNKLFYSIKFDEYSFGQDNLINQENDFILLQDDKRFHRLFLNDIFKLNFVNINNPFILLDEDYHNFIINIGDINNNKIQLQGIFSGAMLSNNNLFKLMGANNSIIEFNENLTINLKSRYKEQTNSIKAPLINNKLNQNQLNSPFDVLEFYKSDNSGISTRKNYITLTKLDSYKINGKIRLKHLDAGIIIEFEEDIFSGYIPKLELHSNNNDKQTLNLYRKKKNLLSSKIINITDLDGIKKINIIYDSSPNLVFEKVLNNFTTNTSDTYFYKKINVDFDSNSHMTPAFSWIEENNISINNYEVIVEPFKINPSSIPFKNGIIISTDYNNCNYCSFYKYNNDSENWNLINSEINSTNISANIKSSGTYALLKENSIPEINNLKPSINGRYNSKDINEISFNAQDQLSGLNAYKIDIWLNSKKLFYDYIPYRKLITAPIKEKLIPGKQELKIDIFDRLGNKKSVYGDFTIIEYK